MAELGSPGVHSPIRRQSDEDAAAQDHGTDREPRGDIGLRAGGVVRTAKAGLTNEQQPHSPETDEATGRAEVARSASDQPRPDDEPGDHRERRKQEGKPEQRAKHETREQHGPGPHLSDLPLRDHVPSVRAKATAVKEPDIGMLANTGRDTDLALLVLRNRRRDPCAERVAIELDRRRTPDERAVIAGDQAEALKGVIDAVLNGIGLTEVQRERAIEIAVRELRRAAGEDSG
jgi:hypothetical protein